MSDFITMYMAQFGLTRRPTSSPQPWKEIYGTPVLKHITLAKDFWPLYHELMMADAALQDNCYLLLYEFTRGGLYGLYLPMNDNLWSEEERNNPLFCQDTWYLLPCMCILSSHGAVHYRWEHPRAASHKLVEQMITQLGDKVIYPVCSVHDLQHRS